MTGADGGGNAAWGFRYQYLRTLEALMDAAEQPERGVVAAHVEGRPGPDGTRVESIDYELSDADGRIMLAVQVKARAPGAVLGAGEVFRPLASMVRKRDANRYELLAGAGAGESARNLVATLEAGLAPAELKAKIDAILARVSAREQRSVLAGLTDEELARLGRAGAAFDERDDTEITESLRWRLRRFRDRSRAGLGSESAGLLIGYLISEILRRAGRPMEATVTLAQFRSLLLADGATVAQALGRRDWGAVIGAVPRVPDVRRAEMLDRIVAALPASEGTGSVARCTLTGVSGIGKSCLAVGYLLERADIYDVIFWADGESEKTLAASFSRMFRYLRGEGASEPGGPADVRDAVLADLSCTLGRWLLILDNCMDERLSDSWMPRAGNGHVIVTTVNSARTAQDDTRIQVGGMLIAEAVALARRRLDVAAEPDDAQLRLLDRLARELEGWPLVLELACAYLRNEHGVEGIPGYLDHMKRASLSDPEAVPLGYRQTLDHAVGLCLERIQQKADGPDPRSAWVATVALRVLPIIAYMSSRQIPVYLVMSVPEIDPGQVALSDMAPVIIDDPRHPPVQVVSMLRAYSLVTPDGLLPHDGISKAEDRRHDSTISFNSILQEIVQEHFDAASFTGLIIDRLAWHTERWMKAAFELGAHERALILATHASALEQHAARLNLKTDFIEYMRGNLAAVQFRQDRSEQVIPLLRSEIEHYRGREEEHARLLTCQASMQLASALADQKAATPGDIASHLETAYLIIVDRVLQHPEAAAFLIATLRSILTQLELNDIRDKRLVMLATAAGDVAGRLPQTPQSAAIRAHDEIDVCMNDHDCARAADLARTLLAGDFLAEDTPESNQLRAMTRASLVEALATQRDIAGALAELDRFIADVPFPRMYIREVMHLVHDTGYLCALLSLAGVPLADELLTRLLADGRADLVQAAYPGETSDRVDLLAGVNALNQGSLSLASRRASEFLERQAAHGGLARQIDGWRELGRTLADSVTTHRAKDSSRGQATSRKNSGPGRLQLLASPIRDSLASCDIKLLPVLTAVAVMHDDEPGGTPGTRCVPACWQLHGALAYLGFDSEVMAAAGHVGREGHEPEQIGQFDHVPVLHDDGTTDGHVILWTETFRQLIDPAIVHARHVQEAAHGQPAFTFPVLLPVPAREVLLNPAIVLGNASRPPLRMSWTLLPQWTPALTPVAGGALDSSLAQGKITLAHATLDVIEALRRSPQDSARLRDRYPQLAALLDDRSQLPPPPR